MHRLFEMSSFVTKLEYKLERSKTTLLKGKFEQSSYTVMFVSTIGLHN